MQTIGERLEEARKRKGISIREAAEATKIRSDYLHKLESNSFDLNLPEIYIRGFLQNYANYLKLNAEKILADYKTLAPNEGRSSRRDNREIYGRMDLSQTGRPAPEGAPTAAAPEAPVAVPAPARPSFPAAAGAGTPAIDPALLFKGGVAVVALLLVLAIVFGIKAISGGTAKPATEIRAAAQQTITLTARDTVRVKLVQELDGAELFQGTMVKGESHTFPKRGSLLLTATALENVEIDISGKRQANPYTGYNRVQIP
ncbi:MAG TPA: helix-turn-helix domain-containing protein [Opitutaceae bacterium]|nr:helix-turn-helix domain-containing protein [Opitutaceae bacterium]